MSWPHKQPIPATSFAGIFHRHGLFKILNIISRFPAVDVPVPDKQRNVERSENVGFDVDLNVNSRDSPDIAVITPPHAAETVAGCKNRVEEEKATEHSVMLHVGDKSSGIDCNGVSDKQYDDESSENREFDVVVNIGLPASPEIEIFSSPLTAESGADCGNRVFEKNDLRKAKSTVEDEKPKEQSVISHVGDQSSRIDCDGASEEIEEQKLRDEGYLGLLIEAAQFIAGNESFISGDVPTPSPLKFPATSTVEKGGETKRKQQCWTAATEAEWYAEFEDTSPVVKSKRGRSQVLPYKYRDSVVEPLVRWPASRYRSNQNDVFPSKRRTKW